MKIQAPKARLSSEERVFSGRFRIRLEPLDLEGRPMVGSKSFIVLETTLDELHKLVCDSIRNVGG